jgi:hypothetical protein
MSQAKGDNTSIVNAAPVRPVTRRNLIAGGTAALAVAGAALPSKALNADAETDPIVILWRQYRPAEDAARRIGNRIVEIEGELEHPGVTLGTVIALADWKARKVGPVEVNRQRKDREEAAGLTDLPDKQDELDAMSGDLYAQIESGTATSWAGLAVKLLIAFEHTERRESIEDLPCCLYASMLRDLLPFCPADVAERARIYVEAEADQSEYRRVGDCLPRSTALRKGVTHERRRIRHLDRQEGA